MSVETFFKAVMTTLVFLNSNNISTQELTSVELSEGFEAGVGPLKDARIKSGPLGQSHHRPTTPVRCLENQDLVIVLDNNLLINSTNYIRSLVFVADVALEWQRQRKNNRIGFLTYSTPVGWRFRLTKDVDIDRLEVEVVTAVSHNRDKGRFTDRGIKEAFNNLEGSVMTGVQRNILVITDGESDAYYPTIENAKLSISKGIRMFAIGVGDLDFDPFEDELLSIVGRQKGNILRVERFVDLKDMIAPVMKMLCGGSKSE